MIRYRIFHLIKGLGRGGAERLLVEGLRCASAEKFTYGYGYFLPWKNAFVPDLEQQGAEVICFCRRTSASIVLSYRKVARFLEKWKPDLLHCHLPLAGICGRLAARRLNVPVVYTEHNLMERYHPVTRQANLRTWKWQDCAIAVSREVADSIQARVDSDVRVKIIQNGINTSALVPTAEGRNLIRSTYGITQNAVVIGTVAALRAGKNLSDWIRAAVLLFNKNPTVHFVIVGDGPLRETLMAEVSASNLGDHFHFAGLQEDVIPFYSAMDIFMSSSTFEGLPLALLEAMAMKLPIVATAVGGVPEVVTEGSSGFLVPPKAPELLAEKAQLLVGQPDLRTTFGREGRAIVTKSFSMQRMSSELEQLYLEIIENRRSNQMK